MQKSDAEYEALAIYIIIVLTDGSPNHPSAPAKLIIYYIITNHL
ncbi:hypothetical protein HMPREF2533_01304 [Bacteroides fragilis]|nr:hypothetical protein HMPREF2530_01304 [Bacteroides fragilis]KXU48194.1 hypothetical protein HMPREF2533_01304 [Bacteroides fragilis]